MGAERRRNSLRAVNPRDRLRIFTPAGNAPSLEAWPPGRRPTFGAARRNSRHTWTLPQTHARFAPRDDRHSPRRGRHSTPHLGGFVQEERFALGSLPFSILLAGIVGLIVGNAKGGLERQQERRLM